MKYVYPVVSFNLVGCPVWKVTILHICNALPDSLDGKWIHADLCKVKNNFQVLAKETGYFSLVSDWKRHKTSLQIWEMFLMSKKAVGERGGSVVECRTPEREVGGSKPTAAVLCPWARHFTPRKYWLITQEAVAPSRYDWKIVDWDVKPQHKQTNKKAVMAHSKGSKMSVIFFLCLLDTRQKQITHICEIQYNQLGIYFYKQNHSLSTRNEVKSWPEKSF